MNFSCCIPILAVSLALADGSRGFAQPPANEPLPDGRRMARRSGTMRRCPSRSGASESPSHWTAGISLRWE